MKLNVKFISNIQEVYGELGTSWLNNLSSSISLLCEKWNFRFIKVMPNLTYHFVALVENYNSNQNAILKIAPTNQNIVTEAKWFQYFDKGIPKIYWVDEEHHAFLKDHLDPGKPLSSLIEIDDDNATRIICQVIRELQSTKQMIPLPFQHLSTLSSCFSILEGRIDSRLLSQAVSWFHELTSESTHAVLLHGDLHHENILSSGETWKVIDPHGYVGDPVFECSVMIYNPTLFPQEHSLPQTIERRLKILSEELRFDAKRVHAWAFCMTMLSIAWTVEDHGHVPEFKLTIAKIIDETPL